MNDSSPINMPLAEAEQATRTLMDYAYEQGFHEMGYDPLAALIEAARAEGATAERERWEAAFGPHLGAGVGAPRTADEVADAVEPIRTAERQRLAGMASEEDREMVQWYGYLCTESHRAHCSGEACCEAPDRDDADKAEAEALGVILATLTALRSACAEVERLREAVKPAAGDGPCCCGETTDCYYCRPR